ncbi:MAG: ABC-F family ATP-binding cassette domain-containing protein [Lachnospira sp.]|nr:ABC-F family ATP-binding cassette domain-containing protein [Lachnospira sp.]
MNVLTVEEVSKGYGDRILLDKVTFGIEHNDKVGIIGINGTGKSTLLKIIAGLEETDAGQVVKGNNISIAYLPQNPVFEEGDTILSYVTKGKSYKDEHINVESEAKNILTKLSIFDFEQKITHLSGGQKKRIALARTLVAPADILVLDEPTNHLDNDMVLWLEQYLDKFKGALVMITHDRYFLDRVTNRILEIDNRQIYSYNTNYSGFLEAKAAREEMELASERKRQSILRNELSWVMRGCRARTTKQRARLERYEALKNQDGPAIKENVQMSSISTRMGKKTIEINNISKAYGDRTLIKDFEYIVLRDERIGIIGANGCGKSTLIKIICGDILPDSGSVELGDTIKIGCFSQENEKLDEKLNVIEYIKEIGEFVETVDGKISAAKMLERFLFTPAMQYTPISKLSGGEKRRLYLLSVLMSSPNVLILDEPTNDLDIATLTILEDYLEQFNGIVITVSHDRYFLDNVVDRIFAFEEGGVIRQYEGGYSDYLLKCPKPIASAKVAEAKEKNFKPKTKKLKFTYMEQKEFETIDDDIAKLEDKIAVIEKDILAAATSYGRLSELTKEKEELEEKLAEKMDRWVYLNELNERIQAGEEA